MHALRSLFEKYGLSGFCRKEGIPAADADLIALCAKEITVYIVKHGFSKDKKLHTAEVRFVLRDGKRVLRVRDDCPGDDLAGYLKSGEESDSASQAGLRAVTGPVKEAGYVSSLGLNNLTLIV